jgi:hypothetical protein
MKYGPVYPDGHDCAIPILGTAASNSSAAIIGKMTPLALRAEKFRPLFRIAIKQRVMGFVLLGTSRTERVARVILFIARNGRAAI